MEGNGYAKQTRSWLASVLTDIHLWIPLGVLLAGLLLLRAIG